MVDAPQHVHHLDQIYNATPFGRSLMKAVDAAAAAALIGGASVVLAWGTDADFDRISIDGVFDGPHLMPALSWDGDQIAFNGVATGPHLSGVDGHTPDISWDGDQIVIDGSYGPHLSGTPGADGTRWYNSDGPPTDLLGVPDSYCLDTTTGNVYYKPGTSWTPDPYGNLKGADGVSPSVSWGTGGDADCIVLNGVTGPHLTGPTGSAGALAHNKIWIGDAGGSAAAVTPSGDWTITDAGVATIAAGAVSLSKMANLATYSVIGNNTSSAAAPSALQKIIFPALTTDSQFRAGGFEVQSYAVNNSWFCENAYFDGAAFRYRATGTARKFILNYAGGYYIQRAAAGNAGDPATFTDDLTIYSDGRFRFYGIANSWSAAGDVWIGGGEIRSYGKTYFGGSSIGGSDLGSVAASTVEIGGGIIRAYGGIYVGATAVSLVGHTHVFGDVACVMPYHGFENWTDSAVTFTATSPDRTLKIAKTGAGFSYWRNGTRVTKTTDQTVQITNTIGLWYFYFNTSDVLTASMSQWDILSDNVPAFSGYWNGTSLRIQEERHLFNENRREHNSDHNSEGTRYGTGLVGTFDNTSLSITQGTIYDEGNPWDTGGTLTNCVLWYLNAGTGKMDFVEVTTPYATTGGALAYDASGTLTAVGAGKIVVNDIYCCLDRGRSIYCRAGTAEYTTETLARAAPQATWANAATPEIKLLYRVLYKNQGGTITYVDKIDYRTSGSVPQGGTPAISPHASTHNGSDPIVALGAVQFSGADLGSVASGKVEIGGGILRAYGSIYTNGGVINPTAATWLRCYDGADLTSLELDAAAGTVTIKGAGGALPASLTAGTAVIADGAAAFSGAAPTAGVAGEVRIGGGRVVACVGAGGLHLQPIALNNSLILDNSRYDVGASGFKALSTGYGSYLQFASDGALYFANAPSVAAGAGQTFTTRFTVQADGTVVCVGAAPSSVSAGEVRIGGGIIRTAGEIWAGANLRMITSSSIGYVQGYNGAAYNELKLMGEKVTIDSVGSPLYVLGTAPSTASAGEVRIGGGALYAAGAIHAGTYIEANGSSPFFQLAQAGVAKTYFQWDNANTRTEYYSAGTHYFTISKVQIVTTADGALTVGGKITAKAAVPASFANLAAVQTYLASILT
ncbi:hypothetical protein UFOVP141_8 [uncultured Caudovirales phage]|uniref:Uncharacterized protein n=1 Tax=uncultured Caudovirales phage TaxID=2100421 RepID=A0A6J7VQP0_9CAUD|nr:hypothetical protein UFOVP141_8 [uncultured Caudovirales phage]